MKKQGTAQLLPPIITNKRPVSQGLFSEQNDEALIRSSEKPSRSDMKLRSSAEGLQRFNSSQGNRGNERVRIDEPTSVQDFRLLNGSPSNQSAKNSSLPKGESLYANLLKKQNATNYPGLLRACRPPAWKWMGVPHDAFETGKVRILSITWNMAGKAPRGDPHYDIFHTLNNEKAYHDIYCISSQECMASIAQSMVSTSKEEFNTALTMRLGPDYCLVHSVSLQATHLAVLCHKKLASHISNISSKHTKLGAGGDLANKGGIRISFKLAQSHICFLGAHLTSDFENQERRNADLKMMLDNLAFVLPLEQYRIQKQKTLDAKKKPNVYPHYGWEDTQYDAIILAGDLNYRVYLPLKQATAMIEKDLYDELLKTDQMLIEQMIGGFPSILKEGNIQFAPTYKRVKPAKKKVNTISPVQEEEKGFAQVFDISGLRTPSWTDRIWFGSRDNRQVNNLELMSYDCNNDVKLGDHRPVFAQFLFTFDTEGYSAASDGHLLEAKAQSMTNRQKTKTTIVSDDQSTDSAGQVKLTPETPSKIEAAVQAKIATEGGFGKTDTTARSQLCNIF